MSRSIHSTKRELIDVARYTYSDPKKKKEDSQSIRDRNNNKRRIKEQVKKERRKPNELPPAVAPETIPITVLDQNEYVHYPASPKDLLALMNLLPRGMADGLSSIQLCLGSSEQPGRDKSGTEPDPYTGRMSKEDLPGIFFPLLRGSYHIERAEIRIHAFVYDPSLPERELWELYLRLDMLDTLIHEIAHHFDNNRRVARGRWTANGEKKVEGYARKSAYQLVQKYAIPYLVSAYPQEIERLQKWMSHYGGVSFSISLLVPNPNKWVYHAQHAFEQLVSDVKEGKSLTETRIGFARLLRNAEYYKESLGAIERVLAEDENHLEALTLKADINCRLSDFAVAKALASKVLALDAQYLSAWEVLAKVFDATQEWQSLEAAATRILEMREADNIFRWETLGRRAKARLELGNVGGCEADIAELVETGRRMASEIASRLQEEIDSHTG